MQQAASFIQHRDRFPSGSPKTYGGSRRPWHDLNQPFSAFFHRAAPAVDVLIALVVLGSILTIFNLHRVPSVAAFLTMRVTVKNVALLAVFILFWVVIASIERQFARSGGRSFGTEARAAAILATVGALPVLLFPLTSVSRAFSWTEFGAYWMSSIVAAISARVGLRVAGNVLGPRVLPTRNCVIVGSGPRAAAFARSLEHSTDYRYEVLGFVDDGGSHSHPDILRHGLMGPVWDLSDILKSRAVDEVVIALPVKSCYSDIQSVVTTCERVGVQCRIPSDVFTYSIGRPRLASGESRQGITLDVVRHDGTVFMKRILDLFGAAAGLILLAPLMVCAAALICLSSRGPVLFRQPRYGYNKRVFTMYKFRTMSRDAERRQGELEERNEMNGPVFKIRDDPRITPVGRFLRRTSIDELPQLWNVFAGTMSLVGPRPLPLRDVSRFSEAWLMRRFSVKPGMTCLWQISGRNHVDFDRWIELDLQYIDDWSLLLDLRILLRTAGAVIRGSGAE